MMYPILAMVMADKDILQWELEDVIHKSKAQTSRILNGQSPLTEQMKNQIFAYVAPCYVSKRLLFLERGSDELWAVKIMLSEIGMKGGKQDDSSDGRCEPGMETVHSEPGQSGAA